MADRLAPGERLQVNDSLVSPAGQYSLVLQEDGNLVLYDPDGRPLWASGTAGQNVGEGRMQEDGNLVLYAPGGEAVWASDTYGNAGAYLALQDDRNLVIYAADGSPVRATNTGA